MSRAKSELDEISRIASARGKGDCQNRLPRSSCYLSRSYHLIPYGKVKVCCWNGQPYILGLVALGAVMVCQALSHPYKSGR
jgi:hypothetical protein